MTLQNECEVTYPDKSTEVFKLKPAKNGLPSSGTKDGFIWFTTVHGDLLLFHPSQYRKMRFFDKAGVK